MPVYSLLFLFVLTLWPLSYVGIKGQGDAMSLEL